MFQRVDKQIGLWTPIIGDSFVSMTESKNGRCGMGHTCVGLSWIHWMGRLTQCGWNPSLLGILDCINREKELIHWSLSPRGLPPFVLIGPVQSFMSPLLPLFWWPTVWEWKRTPQYGNYYRGKTFNCGGLHFQRLSPLSLWSDMVVGRQTNGGREADMVLAKDLSSTSLFEANKKWSATLSMAWANMRTQNPPPQW